MAPSPEKFVESALKTIGVESRTTGYTPHCLIIGVINALRYMCETGAVWLVAKTMLNIRGRALRRKKIRDDARKTLQENIPVIN